MSSEDRKSWGTTLFADDLRQEIGGKFSLMGIYQADMIHQQDFPISLPKFAMLIRYYEIKDAFKEDLNIKIFLPGNGDVPQIYWKLSAAARDNAQSPYEADDADSERLLTLTMPIVFSPLIINEEGFIKVRVQCGETTTRLGRLMIRKMTPTNPLPNV